MLVATNLEQGPTVPPTREKKSRAGKKRLNPLKYACKDMPPKRIFNAEKLADMVYCPASNGDQLFAYHSQQAPAHA